MNFSWVLFISRIFPQIDLFPVIQNAVLWNLYVFLSGRIVGIIAETRPLGLFGLLIVSNFRCPYFSSSFWLANNFLVLDSIFFFIWLFWGLGVES